METELWEPEKKALVSTGEIQAGFTEEVAFDLDAKRRQMFQVERTTWTKAQRQETVRHVWDLVLACEEQGAISGAHHGALGMPGEGICLCPESNREPF